MARSHNDIIDVPYPIETAASRPGGESRQGRKGEPPSEPERPLNSGPYRLARFVALASMVFGATVLIGWWLNLPNIQTIWPRHGRVPPVGGIIPLLLGLALLLKAAPAPLRNRLAPIAGNLAALVAAALSFLTLLEYVFGWNLGVDQWFFQGRLKVLQMPLPGRLSFPGALGAFCLAAGMAVMDVRIKGIWLNQLLAVFASLVALLALIGHLCHVPEFYGQLSDKRQLGMPLQSLLGLLCLAGALLCARPERGLMAILWSYTPGGLLARWLLLAPAAGLFLTGLVYLIFTNLLPVDHAVRTWMLGFADVFFVTVPIWGAAHALHKVGLERDRAQQELEERVGQRTAELSNANAALHAEIRERQQIERALREARDRLESQAAQLEQRVQERTAQLAETVGDLEAFSYSVAHDMRAPLRGMQGFAHLLLEEYAPRFDAEARDYLERIANSAARMDLLIQDALDYTQVLRAETELKPLDLDSLTRQFVATFPGWQSPQADIQIVGALPLALGHEGSFVQCLSNLIGNAVKFVPKGTTARVRIWAESFPSHVRLYIEDNGIGIASKDHDRVFRMFERLNPSDEYEGTGIGLAVVRKAVERMKGRVDFESQPGRGTRFYIDLLLPQPPREAEFRP